MRGSAIRVDEIIRPIGGFVGWTAHSCHVVNGHSTAVAHTRLNVQMLELVKLQETGCANLGSKYNKILERQHFLLAQVSITVLSFCPTYLRCTIFQGVEVLEEI